MVFMGKIVCTILFVFSAVIAQCQDEQPLVMKGNELYRKQQFDKAAEEYQKAAEINAKNAKVQYNLGNALYKTKKNEAAEKAFDAAAENTKDASAKSKALYNKGVSYSRENKLNESIQSYKESLRLNSEDEEARQNLQKALNDLKKQPPPPKPKEDKKKQDKNNNKQKQKQPEQEKNNSKLNQKQVEQMLNALRQDEKKLQQDLQKKNNIGTPNAKDW